MTTPICRNWAFAPASKAADESRHLYTHFFQAPLKTAMKMASKEFEALYPGYMAVILPELSGIDDESPST